MYSESRNYQSAFLLLIGIIITYIIVNTLFGIFNQAYFWDELGVYSRSAMHMYHHGLSLSPDSVPDELSRGHPLFCSFYFALAFKLFGLKPLVAHFAAGTLNSIGFLFVYLILLKYQKPFLALVSTLSIFVQPLFLSQAVLILPEMPLMVLTLASICFYLYEKIFWSMIMAIIALQIKESALVLPMAFLISEIIRYRKINTRRVLMLFLIPALSFTIFIFLQKLQRGYFFYPLHTSLASFDIYYIHERWQHFKEFILCEQGHLFTIIPLSIVLIIVLIKQFKNIHVFSRSSLVVLPIFITGAILFLVLNYYLSRYTLYFIVFLYIGFFLLLYNAFAKQTVYIYLVILMLFISGIYHWNRDKEYTDVDFSYTRHIANIQQCISEFNSDKYIGKTIGMDFPASAAYWNTENGYFPNGKHMIVPINDTLKEKDFLLFTYPGNIADTAKWLNEYTTYKTLENAYAYSKIYKKKR